MPLSLTGFEDIESKPFSFLSHTQIIVVFCLKRNFALARSHLQRINISVHLNFRANTILKMYSQYSVNAAVCSVVFPALASLAVALRLRARKIKSLRYAADDYIIISCLVSNTPFDR